MKDVRVANSPDTDSALRNLVAISPKDKQAWKLPEPCYVTLRHLVFSVTTHEAVEPGTIGLSKVQRSQLRVALNDKVDLTPFHVGAELQQGLASVTLDVAFLSKGARAGFDYDGKLMAERIKEVFFTQVWSIEQKVLLSFEGENFVLTVVSLSRVEFDTTHDHTPASSGLLFKGTDVYLQSTGESVVRLKNIPKAPSSLMGPSFNFEAMGIGGLDAEFSKIFRRAFASRLFPAEFMKSLGVRHVKGMLLYGPPGTGKTLIARQIGKMLDCREPKIVSGPEVLDKYVGGTEKNVRALFAEAEKEYAERGDESALHIIIMDELDAICRQRGSVRDGTGVHDTLVNQLLAKIDGVNSLNNILLIGMTNRKDMIDEALLRPGRLEIHVEIGLPDEPGRLQILKIHTSKQRENNRLEEDVDLARLAELTKNFSGAEIEGLVKAAVSFALNRHINPDDLTKKLETDSVRICMDDFLRALHDVVPAFGAATNDFEQALTGGFIEYSDQVTQLYDTARSFLREVATSERVSMLTILLEGASGVGKTAFAAQLSKYSDFPFIKVISPDQFIGFSETGKVQEIHKVFDNAYKSPLSIVVIDDIEVLLEYAPIGPRFSNAVLQALKVLLKKPPPKSRHLLVIGIARSVEVLEALELSDEFTTKLHLAPLHSVEEIAKVMDDLKIFSSTEDILACAKQIDINKGIPIKKLLLLCELAKQGSDRATVGNFTAALLNT